MLTKIQFKFFAISTATLLLPFPVAFANSTEYGSSLSTLQTLRASVIRFKMNNDRYPTEAEGLLVLAEEPMNWKSSRPWRQLIGKSGLNDAWGNRFIYSVSGDDFRIYSKGTDGVSASAGMDPDDLNSWSSKHDGDYYYLGDRRRFFGFVALVVTSVAFPIFLGIAIRRRRASNKHANTLENSKDAEHDEGGKASPATS